MSEFVISLAIGCLFALSAIVLVMAIYFTTRKILPIGDQDHRTFDAAASIAYRIAALYGLILALVYAQELDDYKGIRINLAEEAVAVADVYNDIQRYGGPMVKSVQVDLARYLYAVVYEEWPLLGRHAGLSPTAWQRWEAAYLTLLDLEPQDNRQQYLVNRMRDRVTSIARYRQIRESTVVSGFSGLFWGPALIGLTLLAVPFYVFPPTRSNLILLATFGIYSGVVLFFIYMFSNPFEVPGKLQPTPFLQLLHGEIGDSLPR